MLSFLLCAGLILVPNGENLGYAMGDQKFPNFTIPNVISAHRTTGNLGPDNLMERNFTEEIEAPASPVVYTNYHPWGIFFTVLGTVLLDFDADACQSPARAYLLDVTVEGKFFVCNGYLYIYE